MDRKNSTWNFINPLSPHPLQIPIFEWLLPNVNQQWSPHQISWQRYHTHLATFIQLYNPREPTVTVTWLVQVMGLMAFSHCVLVILWKTRGVIVIWRPSSRRSQGQVRAVSFYFDPPKNNSFYFTFTFPLVIQNSRIKQTSPVKLAHVPQNQSVADEQILSPSASLDRGEMPFDRRWKLYGRWKM